MYAWEGSFLNVLTKIRSKEIEFLRHIMMARAANSSVSQIMPVFAAIFSFIVYGALGNVLQPARVFTSLSLFYLLRIPLIQLPLMIMAVSADLLVNLTCAQLTRTLHKQYIDAYTAIKRIESVLIAPEVEESVRIADLAKDTAIEFRQATFSWDQEDPDNDHYEEDNGENQHLNDSPDDADLGEPSSPDKSSTTKTKPPSTTSPVVENLLATNSVSTEEYHKMKTQPSTIANKAAVENSSQIISSLPRSLVTSMKSGSTTGITSEPPEVQRKRVQIDPAHDSDDESSVSDNEDAGGSPKSSFALRDLTFEVKKGSLVAIVGSVGSGKSSLLAALVGEMRRVQGEFGFQGTVGCKCTLGRTVRLSSMPKRWVLHLY